MKTYLRILSYARPMGWLGPKYAITTLIAIILGTVQLTMIIPLLNILFVKQPSPEEMERMRQAPEFTGADPQYFIDLFNYYFVQQLDKYGNMGALQYVCGIVIVITLLGGIFTYLSNVTLSQVRANVITNLRMDLFNKVSMLHLGYFSDERKGDVMSRVTNDIQEVEKTVVDSLKTVLRDPVQIIVFFIALFYISVKLTLFTIIFLPVTGLIISEVVRRLKKKARQSQESLGRIVEMIDETISGMRVVKAFNARPHIIRKFGKEVGRYARLNVSMAQKNEAASPISQLLGVGVAVGIILYGGQLIFTGDSTLSGSAFIGYIAIFIQVLNPSKAISRSLSNIQRGLAAGDRIFQTLDTVPAIQDSNSAKELDDFSQQIEFRNVSFAYGDTPVLKNINLTVSKGKMIALVGPSGGGKSTLADLVPRFYDPKQGGVYLDGHDLRHLTLESIRRQMGVVTQESILFNDTIFSNIAFGKPEASEEEVVHAAKIANAHDFITATEQGYQTVIGERGSKLSGGQRQRLSIARAVLKNPPILILDEATSALDTESEKLVQQALTSLMQNRTSIVIAHRLSTIKHADEIIVIQNGEIVERGTHDQLMENQGMYRKLNQMQMAHPES
ncbi:ABC transporter ATP-binding protein [Roseivirga sp. BDSF3-8]|uniref:ABC transporter ATP-binding protein n=1 Tax=Roseivirga sp. BDSF3-8 TaxID=3241598 RepID=UPI003531B6DB